MSDYFALLEAPRRPWLDEAKLKSRFLALSAEVHPDRVHNAGAADKQRAQERCTTLNAAYNCLREPRARLAHLLELERGAKPETVQKVPPDLVPLFSSIGPLLRQTDALLAEKNAANSALMKAQIFSRTEPVLDELENLKLELNSREAAALQAVQSLDDAWEQVLEQQREAMLGRLEQLRHLLNYLAKWKAQVQERAFQLTV